MLLAFKLLKWLLQIRRNYEERKYGDVMKRKYGIHICIDPCSNLDESKLFRITIEKCSRNFIFIQSHTHTRTPHTLFLPHALTPLTNLSFLTMLTHHSVLNARASESSESFRELERATTYATPHAAVHRVDATCKSSWEVRMGTLA